MSLSDARLVADPELKFLPSGTAALNARCAVNHRRKDKATGEWKDAGTTWLTLIAYGALAEEAAERLRQGDLVVGSGEFQAREYETKEGEKRIANEVTLRHLGRDLVWPQKQDDSGGVGNRKPAAKPAYTEPPF
jgi:single-strand DNA-binding protein